jgi:fucose permease
MCLYGAFGVTTLFSSFIVKKLGYKKSFFFASFGYAICEAAALIVVYDVHISIPLIWTI